MFKDYIKQNGIVLPSFMTVMAVISLTILYTNIPARVVPGMETVQHLFIVWGVLMATGAILVLLGHRVGFHIFAIGAFAECAMMVLRAITEGGDLGGAIVGIMPIIAYAVAARRVRN